jgi:hypothetical protein
MIALAVLTALKNQNKKINIKIFKSNSKKEKYPHSYPSLRYESN